MSFLRKNLFFTHAKNKGTDQLHYLACWSKPVFFASLIKIYLVSVHRVQRRMISVDNFFVFFKLLFFALLLLYVT